LLAGCSQYVDPNVPEPIRPYVEPEFGTQYLLYRPAGYDGDHAWPLIVTCHSSFPDSPDKQIRVWTQLAESYGFLVAVPALQGNKAVFPPKPPKQIELQRDDERHILAAVRHIRAAHNISEDRVFIHGWSAGAYTALYTGLRYPEVFRAVALSHPRFDEGYLADAEGAMDPFQPVLVDYELSDAVAGKHARRCVEWLQDRSAELTVDAYGSSREVDADRVVAFFEEVVRSRPWVRIRALPASGTNPLQVQFKLQCTCRPQTYHWEFGDGEGSTAGQPVHAYAAPGTYVVVAVITDADGTEYRRSARLKVPEMVLGTHGDAAPVE
jgi:dienelactone hydrolase